MASQYFAILTDYGTAAFAKALSSKQPLQLTTFAVGDGNGQNITPTANRTALAREKHRATVSAVSLDPRNNKQVIVELTIPENIGGFYIREMGVFDNQNKLVAYANCPESFKPQENSGSGKIQVLRMILKVASSSAVTLSVDHSVIFVTRQQLAPQTITATSTNSFDETGHTHEIAKASTTTAGIVQLDSSTNSNAEDKAATPKAVKAAYDLAHGKQSPATTLAGYGITNFKVEHFTGDVNTLKTDGVYAVAQASRSQNLPVPGNGCHIVVIGGGDSSWCRQFAYITYSSDVYERHQTSYLTDNWTAWVRVDSLDKIPLSQKSDAINLDSSEHVATSKAAKTAYDKGAAAQAAADNAQRTADDGVNKANSAQATANSAVTKADNAQRTANDGVSKANAAQHAADNAQRTANTAQQTATNANNNADGRVSKAGDVMNGFLTIYGKQAGGFSHGLILKNESGGQGTSGFIDFVQSATGAQRASIWFRDLGQGDCDIELLTTPKGSDINKQNRQLHTKFDTDGSIWNKNYGYLHNFFAKKSETYIKNRFGTRFYNNHYNGAQVFDIPMSDNSAMRVIEMNVSISNGYGEFNLPEAFTGWALPVGNDVGEGKWGVGISMLGNNKVRVWGRASNMVIAILIIGYVGW